MVIHSHLFRWNESTLVSAVRFQKNNKLFHLFIIMDVALYPGCFLLICLDETADIDTR